MLRLINIKRTLITRLKCYSIDARTKESVILPSTRQMTVRQIITRMIEERREASRLGGGQKRIDAQHKKVERGDEHCHFIL